MTISKTSKLAAAGLAAAALAGGVLLAPSASAGNIADYYVGPVHVDLHCQGSVLSNHSEVGTWPVLAGPVLTLDGLC